MCPADLEVSKDTEIFQSVVWQELRPQGASEVKIRSVPLGGEHFNAGQTDIGRNKARTLWRQVEIELLEVGIQAFVGALNIWGGSEDQQGLVNARGTGNAHVGQSYSQI